jgi:hypothetical protein
MRKAIAVGATLLALSMARADSAQQWATEQYGVLARQSLLATEVPEIIHEFLFGAADIDEASARRTLLAEIAKWLSANFDLPLMPDQPRLAHASAEKLFALRYGRLVEPMRDRTTPDPTAASERRATVAIYSDAEQTIYLPEGWTGRTPAELSVLVHELVHHLQNASKLTYECHRAREKLAYAAQERWLKLFGRDLEGEFEVNQFTVLVNSTCGY